MKKAVINASPIISLCKIGVENILFELFEKVFITDEVIGEIDSKPGRMSNFIKDSIAIGKLKKYSVAKKSMIDDLYGKMHKGELSVVIAGLELQADYVIIDEIAARNFAESLSLNPIGTIGLLRIAKKKGLIQSVKPFLMELREKGMWLSKQIIEKIIK
ncbi:MAG TPA: DUF3368 domain-containing protein [Spirochaetia bacterium]|nr:MAG: hypothetical protein A2Y41_01170 [Spirochaetes bacterium GWB1_36_13]HCL57520.1 DUF3368 domain-containing protein [Spirochaetia bacterium]